MRRIIGEASLIQNILEIPGLIGHILKLYPNHFLEYVCNLICSVYPVESILQIIPNLT